jgi:hypothetical protein
VRVAFACSALEPGRDGVGDYTRCLAAEIIRQGHLAVIVALNDASVSQSVTELQETEGEAISVLRLPSAMPWPQRIEMAGKFLDEFQPEWMSLQFVCYGFHPKGLVHGLAGKLSPLFAKRKVHMMFHEVWLCKELGWGWRQRAIGLLQLRFIQGFVNMVKPSIMHTSNAAYAALLNRSGIPVTELGLFGNVPVLNPSNSEWMKSQMLTALGVGYLRKDTWLIGFFGALHAQWPEEPLLTFLRRAAESACKRPVLLSIGRIGGAGLELWNRMANTYIDHFTFVRLGEQPQERISEYLSWLDFGIATTPRSILGKSGTVISMFEHGLPVIVNRDDTSSTGSNKSSDDPLVILCDANFEKRLRLQTTKGPRGSRLPRVAQTFLRALEGASAPQLCCC